MKIHSQCQKNFDLTPQPGGIATTDGQIAILFEASKLEAYSSGAARFARWSGDSNQIPKCL